MSSARRASGLVVFRSSNAGDIQSPDKNRLQFNSRQFAKFASTRMMPDLNIAKVCLRFSHRAYNDVTIDEPSTGTQVLIGGLLDDPGALVIAFRGTRGIRDMITDAKFLVKTEWASESGSSNARLHRGFSEAWWSVAGHVLQRASEAKRIFVCGHSLGGAVALPCALYLAQHGLPVEAVHVFGCPRTGNGAWRNLYNSNLHSVTLRWEAQGDPIPYSPPWINGYRHAGRAAYLSNSGGMKLDPAMWEHVAPFTNAIVEQAKNIRSPLKSLSIFGPHHLVNYEKLFSKLEASSE
ncbi:MAG: lipase family protein [Verrucomicrobia bacterium]|nr:lipase family protein [Verrucomicrobiota bacterium]